MYVCVRLAMPWDVSKLAQKLVTAYLSSGLPHGVCHSECWASQNGRTADDYMNAEGNSRECIVHKAMIVLVAMGIRLIRLCSRSLTLSHTEKTVYFCRLDFI